MTNKLFVKLNLSQIFTLNFLFSILFHLLAKKFWSKIQKFSIQGYATSYPSTLSLANQFKIPSNKKYAIWLCFYELYNDAVYDLLTIPSKDKKNLANERPQLKIREDLNRIPYVEGKII